MTRSEAQRPKQDDTQTKSSRKHDDVAALPKLEERRPVTPRRHGRPSLARQVSHDCLSGIADSHRIRTKEDKADRSSPVQSLTEFACGQRITLPGFPVKTSHNLAECRSPRNGVPPMSNPLDNENFLSLHTKALQLEAALQPLKQILLRLMSHATWNKKGLFNSPVDPVAMQAPDYFKVVSDPMDLGTVKKKLHGMVYESSADVMADIRLCFRNAMNYNPPTNAVHESARKLLQVFEDQLRSSCLAAEAVCSPWECQQSISEPPAANLLHNGKKPVKKRNCRHSCPSCLGHSCYMCGQGCLPLEHSLLICHGNYCCGARIRKGGLYYVASDGHLIYCQRCYAVLPSALTEVDKDTKSRCRYKSELLKRRNDEEIVEKWIRCVTCNKSAHQICALFNPFAQDATDYECPTCSKINRGSDESVGGRHNDDLYTFVAGSEDPIPFSFICPPEAARQRAFALRRSPTADFMEQKVRELLSGLHNHTEKTISVRLISNTDKTFQIPSIIRSFFETSKHHHSQENAPLSKVSYQSKAIALFQAIDGFDVCLFCMYVNEYEQQSVDSDEKRVYIAYLDSVEYFRPSSLRTEVYQEMIISYLATAKKRGFTNAHIWACPPIRGNSFIFWQHPAEQRTPKMDRLTSWYNATLARAANIGIVSDVVSLYESDFEMAMDDLGTLEGRTVLRKMPCPPLLEGDFWVEEALRLYRHTAHKYSREISCSTSAASSVEIPGARGLCPALQLASMLKNQIINNPSSQAFRRPVNADILKIGSYHDIIKEPMDLGTVYTKLSLGAYEKLIDFVRDMELVFTNAMKFNPPNNLVHQKAIVVRDLFFHELNVVTRRWCNEPEMCPDHSWRAFSEKSLLLLDCDNQKATSTSSWTNVRVNRAASLVGKGERQDLFDPSSIHRRMAGKDIKVFEKKHNCSKKQKRKDILPVSQQEARATKRQRQTWLGEEVGRSVRRMRTSFFNCFLQGKPFRSESFEEYCKNFAFTTNEPTRESRIADSRQGFLEFSQLRCLEYDTLRKAKYSTSIILYHLHNDDAPGVHSLCSLCSEEIRDIRWHFLGRVCSKKGWPKFNQRDDCVDEELCSVCYAKSLEKHLYTPIPISI